MEIFQHIMQFTYWNISEHRGQTTRVQDASNIAYDLILHCIKIQTLKYSLYDYSYQDFIKSVSILKMGKIIFFSSIFTHKPCWGGFIYYYNRNWYNNTCMWGCRHTEACGHDLKKPFMIRIIKLYIILKHCIMSHYIHF